MAIFYFLVCVLSFHSSTVNCQSFKRDNSRLSYAKFVRNPFKKLVASSLSTLKVSSIGECTLECVNHQECLSVNFGNQDQGKHTCELIDTDRFKQPEIFTASQDFHHYSIKVCCVDNTTQIHSIYSLHIKKLDEEVRPFPNRRFLFCISPVRPNCSER